jgi:hypothetical protein
MMPRRLTNNHTTNNARRVCHTIKTKAAFIIWMKPLTAFTIIHNLAL